MRLRTLRVRNYRIHRETVVDFDANRTLIGGPNESGKSTLVEALHRAFFLKAKGNTEFHRAMISDHGGKPEVDVVFEAGGVEYELKKCFGTTVTLAAAGRPALSGDEAEAKIAALVAIAEPVSGRAVLAQWGHLWVWQGSGGDDPTGDAAAQSAPLMQRLRDMGGAAALQSDFDAAVAAGFAANVERIFRKNGEAKAGSEWEIAATEEAAGQVRVAAARERLDASLAAADDLERASVDLTAAERSLGDLKREREATDGRAVRVEGLRRTEEAEGRAVAEAEKVASAFRAEVERIEALISDLERRDAALAPMNADVERLRAAATRARESAGVAAARSDEAARNLKSARQRRDHLAACVAVGERTVAVAELAARFAAVEASQQQLLTLRGELARLPQVDAAQLAALRTAADEVTRSQAALAAMAAGLEVVASTEPVVVGGKTLGAGEAVVLSEDTEVSVGGTLRLKIRPGGGTSLAEARRRVADRNAEFERSLAALGLPDVAAANEAAEARRTLAVRIESTEDALRERRADELPAKLAAEREALAAAEADRDRRSAGGGAPPEPAGLRDELTAAERVLAEAEEAEAKARSTRDAEEKASTEAETRLAGQADATERDRRGAADARAQLKLLEATHGDGPRRTQTTRGLAETRNQAERALATTRSALTELDAAHLVGDLARLARAVETTLSAINDARTRIAVSGSRLRSDGSEDPRADLETALAQQGAAEAHARSTRRRAEAIRLLDALFTDAQRSLADRFTRPLAETITAYLECLFGAGATASVVFHEGEFSGLQLTRSAADGGTFAFETLSGGAREQFAAAVRLAVAEVLSADFDGCLPVIFDDAFAYSDPGRERSLQRMLDRAAERGLQIIVLTCDPAPYASLGAKVVALPA